MTSGKWKIKIPLGSLSELLADKKIPAIRNTIPDGGDLRRTSLSTSAVRTRLEFQFPRPWLWSRRRFWRGHIDDRLRRRRRWLNRLFFHHLNRGHHFHLWCRA